MEAKWIRMEEKWINTEDKWIGIEIYTEKENERKSKEMDTC